MGIKLSGLVFVVMCLPVMVHGQQCRCEKVYAEVKMTVENNYAGWFDKINFDNVKRYRDWSEPFKARTQGITDDSLCATVIKEWLAYFTDKHLQIAYTSGSMAKSKGAGISILRSQMDEKAIRDYLEDTKRADAVEGIYENETYRLGITKVDDNVFHAVVLSSRNDNWKSGEVKAIIHKDSKKYRLQFYAGDKMSIENHELVIADNILDMEVMYLDKKFPETKAKRDRLEYEMAKDKYAPSLTFKDGAAIFTFPSFENNSEEQTTYLLKKHEEQLSKAAHWVIDLRNNSGGNYKVGMQLMKYLYTQPYVQYNSEMRMTPLNLDLWFRTYVKSSYDQLDAEAKKTWDAEMEVMKSNYGKNYNASGKLADTISMDAVLPYPQKVALLINRNTVSSGELFTLLARQSKKVTVMGENSGGMMDYGNVVTFKTVCPSIALKMPINRQLWLEDFFSVDKAGIKPEVALIGNNWVEEALKRIKG